MEVAGTLRVYHLGYLARVMVVILFASVIVHGAGIFQVFLPGAGYFALIGLCLTLAAGFVLCLLNQTPVTAISAAAIVAFLIFQNLVFAYNAQVPPNINAVISYLPLVSFVLIRQRILLPQVMLRTLAVLACGYLLIYVLMHNYLVEVGREKNPALLPQDELRGARVRLLLEQASFVMFYATTGRNMAVWKRAAMFLLGLSALWISGSRTYMAVFALVYVLAMFRMLGVAARSALFAIFMAISLIFLSGIFLPWNPLNIVSADNSGLARAMEYTYAIDALRHHWLLGVGLWSDFDSFQSFLKTPLYNPLYPSDLGIIGPYMVFGLFGMIAYVVATYICIVPRFPQLHTPAMRALRLNCVVCGAYGIISPAIVLESSAFFLALLIGCVLRVRRSHNLDIRGGHLSLR